MKQSRKVVFYAVCCGQVNGLLAPHPYERLQTSFGGSPSFSLLEKAEPMHVLKAAPITDSLLSSAGSMYLVDTVAIGSNNTAALTAPISLNTELARPEATSPRKSKSMGTIALWNKVSRRLSTKQDVFGIHKLCASANLVSCVLILGCAAANGWTHVPDQLEGVQLVFQYTTLGLCSSASHMAWKYRSNEPGIRDFMIIIALAASISALGGTWVSPHYEEWMCSQLGQGSLMALSTALLLFGAKCLCQSNFVEGVVKNRMGKRNYEAYPKFRPLLEAGAFVALSVGPFTSIYNIWFYGNFIPSQYAEWMAVHCTMGGPAGLAYQYYMLDVASMFFLYSSFMTTLRDRKLITPTTELIGASLSTAVFFPTTAVFFTTNMFPFPDWLSNLLMSQ